VDYKYKGYDITATARQINKSPNEVWKPLYRIDGTDQSNAWTPRDRTIVFHTKQEATEEAKKRAQWMIDNPTSTASSSLDDK